MKADDSRVNQCGALVCDTEKAMSSLFDTYTVSNNKISKNLAN